MCSWPLPPWHVAEGIARGQRQALQGHDLGVDQQEVLLRNFDFSGGQAEDVAGAQRGRPEVVKAARAAGHRVVAADAFIPAHRQQHGQQPPTWDVGWADVGWLEFQLKSWHVVLNFEPRQRQWLFVDDLQGQGDLFAEECSRLPQRSAIPQANEAVAVPHPRLRKCVRARQTL